MKRALIEGTRVAQVVDAGGDFPVAAPLRWVDCPDDTTTKHTYDGGQFVAWSDTRTQEQLFAELRVQRNKLLSESDWTQLPDAQADAAAWATYRQALRDLPANTADPANPVWPTKP